MATRSPFAGFPKTRPTQRKDKTIFRITPRILTPWRAMIADGLAGLSVALWFLALFFNLELLAPEPGWMWLPYWGSIFLVQPVSRFVLRSLFKARRIMELDEEEFRVRRWYGWIRFDRKRKHRFAALPHGYAQAEQRRQELKSREAQMRGKVVQATPYYGESFELTYLDLGQPYYLMDIYGPKDATAIQTRLEACDAVLDGLSNMGPGATIDPDDDWDTGTGDIDDEDLD